MMCGTIGSFSVISAQWFYPVSADIGCELSTLTLYTTIEMACMGLAMPLVGSLLTRVKLPVLLTGAVLMEVLATAAMAFYSEPWMWYASSVFIGLGLAATSTVTVTPTMGNWFAKKTGFAIGVVWAIQAMFCAVASPLFAAIIMVIGWRAAYLVLAAVSACLALPAVIFVIRYRPEDVGLLPYGYEETSVRQSRGAAPGVSARTAFRSAPFFLCAGIVTLCQGTACMNAIFPTYAEVWWAWAPSSAVSWCQRPASATLLSILSRALPATDSAQRARWCYGRVSPWCRLWCCTSADRRQRVRAWVPA